MKSDIQALVNTFALIIIICKHSRLEIVKKHLLRQQHLLVQRTINIRKRCEYFTAGSKLTMKTPERRQGTYFEHIL